MDTAKRSTIWRGIWKPGNTAIRSIPDASESWYGRAFKQEHPETLYLFAIRLFIDGRPTDEALRLLRKAADKGSKQAGHVLHDSLH